MRLARSGARILRAGSFLCWRHRSRMPTRAARAQPCSGRLGRLELRIWRLIASPITHNGMFSKASWAPLVLTFVERAHLRRSFRACWPHACIRHARAGRGRSGLSVLRLRSSSLTGFFDNMPTKARHGSLGRWRATAIAVGAIVLAAGLGAFRSPNSAHHAASIRSDSASAL